MVIISNLFVFFNIRLHIFGSLANSYKIYYSFNAYTKNFITIKFNVVLCIMY